MTGAAFDRANSRQDWETPPDLMAAVVERFGAMAWDLACTAENAKAPAGIVQHSLETNWCLYHGNMWLNPPYSDIAPWAHKCRWTRERGTTRKIFLLIPASVGSNYWANDIDSYARVLFLSPRIKFVGAKDPYPKDCALCVYGETPGYECWRWKP